MGNFWTTDDGEDIREKVDADKDLPDNGGSFEPLPDKTKVLAIVTDAGIKEKDGAQHAYAVLEIVKPEAYARRKLFPSFWVFDDNPNAADPEKKRKNDKLRFTKLDASCGGKLARKNSAPSGDDIALAFTNKQVIVHVMLMTPKEDGKEPFNWYSDYWPKSAKEISEVDVKPRVQTKRQDHDDDLDDEIPF